MENPDTWDEAEKVINGAVWEYRRIMLKDPDLCGLSVERMIADALREAGLLACRPDGCPRGQDHELALEQAYRENA